MRGIDSYLFKMILSFATNIIAYYLLKTTCLEEIMKTGPEDTDESVASSGWMIILYQKYRAVSWLRGIDSYLFLMILSFTTNIFAYYLLKTTFLEEIMKTGPRGHWWVCSFMRMNDNLVPKIQSSLLVKRNQFIPFSNDFELCNQYFCILPPQNNIFRENHENRPQRTLMSL